MGEFPRDIVGKNIKRVRKFLSLTQSALATYAGISKTSIVNIESGQHNYSVELLDSVLNVIDCKWEEIINDDFKIKPNLKDLIVTKHPEWDLKGIFEKPPSVKNAVIFLLNNNQLKEPLSRHEILNLLAELGWPFSPNSLTKVLTRMCDDNELSRTPSEDGGGFRYVEFRKV